MCIYTLDNMISCYSNLDTAKPTTSSFKVVLHCLDVYL